MVSGSRGVLAFGFLLSGCLLFHPGAVILTLDFSAVDPQTRSAFEEISIFFCDEDGGVRDCSNPANYNLLDSFPLSRAVREKETVGIRIGEFSGLVHFRVVASSDTPAFLTENGLPAALGEALLDPAAPRSLTLPLVALDAEPSFLDVSTELTFDTDPIACVGADDPFMIVWVEAVGGINHIVAKTVDLEGNASGKQTLFDLPAGTIVDEVELAGDASCSVLGLGFIRRSLNPDNSFFTQIQGARIEGLPLLNEQALSTLRSVNGRDVNLTVGFGEGGFGFVWDEDGNDDGLFGASLGQPASVTLVPGNFFNLLRDETFTTPAVSQAGGANGVVAVRDRVDELSLVDLETGQKVPVARARPGNFVFDPQVDLLAPDRVLVAWLECPVGEFDCSVEARIVDRQGNDASGDFPARGSDCAPPGSEGGCFQIADIQLNPFELGIAVGPGGTFAAAWRFQKLSSNNQAFEIQAAFYGPDGPRINPFNRAAGEASIEPIPLDPNFNLTQANPKISALPDGSFVLSWIDITRNAAGQVLSSLARAVVVRQGMADLTAR